MSTSDCLIVVSNRLPVTVRTTASDCSMEWRRPRQRAHTGSSRDRRMLGRLDRYGLSRDGRRIAGPVVLTAELPPRTRLSDTRREGLLLRRILQRNHLALVPRPAVALSIRFDVLGRLPRGERKICGWSRTRSRKRRFHLGA